MQIKICNNVYQDQCVNVPLTIQVWPATMPEATLTEQTRSGNACELHTEWPKVLGGTSLATILKHQIDPTNGNILACGNTNVDRVTAYSLNYQQA